MNEEFGDMIKIHVPFQPDRVFLYNPSHVAEMYAYDNKQAIGRIHIPGFSIFNTYRKQVRKDLFPGSGTIANQLIIAMVRFNLSDTLAPRIPTFPGPTFPTA